MEQRIKELVNLVLNGKMYVDPIETKYDPADLLMEQSDMEVKRLCEYILNQQPKITPYTALTGFINFDGSCVGDIFNRPGHTHTEQAISELYIKPIENLSTFEWQHATADYTKVINIGLTGIIEEIKASIKNHTDPEKIKFLNQLIKVSNTLIEFAEKCSGYALDFAKTVDNPEYKANLTKLSETLHRVPKYGATSFYEGVLAIYFMFSADPDSIGAIDRFLIKLYNHDIDNNIITKEQAKTYLQELFIMLQAKSYYKGRDFTRGGESHFCIGGYLPDGTDGFNELSKLIVDSIMELPLYCPQITLRWTKKLSKENFRYVMNAERNDPNKRVAFANDERRIKELMRVLNISFEDAVNYTTTGCNEPVFMGGISGGTSHANILKCMETVFHNQSDKIVNCKTFDEFYDVFEKELFSDVEKICDYDDKFNLIRGKDTNYISNLVFNGCIESGKTATRGGCRLAIASIQIQGMTSLIDCLISIKQFVYDEKLLTMKQMIDAVKNNWKGYEDIHKIIYKKCCYYGNNEPISKEISYRLYNSIYSKLKGKKSVYGYQFMFGDLDGYNPHHEWYGSKMKATPDGRYDGDPISFGNGQTGGRDRNDLADLLTSIATADPTGISCGATVTNVMLDDVLIRNDDYFNKTVDLFETYFENGGVHYQLSYVSREDLLKAKENPNEYNHLRVRVSGFSEYFVKLCEEMQDDVIARTSHSN